MTTYKALKSLLKGEVHLWTKDRYIMRLEKGRWYALTGSKSYTMEEVDSSEVLAIWNRPDFSFDVDLDLKGE